MAIGVVRCAQVLRQLSGRRVARGRGLRSGLSGATEREELRDEKMLSIIGTNFLPSLRMTARSHRGSEVRSVERRRPKPALETAHGSLTSQYQTPVHAWKDKNKTPSLKHNRLWAVDTLSIAALEGTSREERPSWLRDVSLSKERVNKHERQCPPSNTCLSSSRLRRLVLHFRTADGSVLWTGETHKNNHKAVTLRKGACVICVCLFVCSCLPVAVVVHRVRLLLGDEGVLGDRRRVRQEGGGDARGARRALAP